MALLHAIIQPSGCGYRLSTILNLTPQPQVPYLGHKIDYFGLHLKIETRNQQVLVLNLPSIWPLDFWKTCSLRHTLVQERLQCMDMHIYLVDDLIQQKYSHYYRHRLCTWLTTSSSKNERSTLYHFLGDLENSSEIMEPWFLQLLSANLRPFKAKFS
jgi:hypothetical protein